LRDSDVGEDLHNVHAGLEGEEDGRVADHAEAELDRDDDVPVVSDHLLDAAPGAVLGRNFWTCRKHSDGG